ncbi:hypothetical protein IG193_04340 [Infirmifilum lucidum]|uniref:Uncharacterized protein n=1 Tax=Infirmifilum lucidum TaxID=2776706 RepID=A0A7L9FIT9_9CREN|nr:hypothetical protein [Infirmifilum lucidum]QOJ79689.1 hypothetical protein IG193_04340 [Infirmifilum lucidum]
MSSGGVCPGLYRDAKGKFYCKYAGGTEVDPAFMPCLMEYWECPYYIGWRKKAGTKEESVTPPLEAGEKTTAPAPQPVAIAEHVTGTKLLEEASSELDSLINRATELSKIWEEYEKAAREVIGSWEEIRDRLEKELLSIESSLDAYVAELERIELKHKLGVLDDTQYEGLKSELDRRIAEKTSEKEDIQRKLDELDRLIIPHYKRVKAAEVKPEIAKLRLALNKLEQKFKEGGITEEAYRRVKAEIEARLKRLERIREEVEEQ